MCKQGRRAATTNNLVSEPLVAMSTRSDLGPNWSLYVKTGSDQCAGSSCKGPGAALAVVIYEGGPQADEGGEMPFHSIFVYASEFTAIKLNLCESGLSLQDLVTFACVSI